MKRDFEYIWLNLNRKYPAIHPELTELPVSTLFPAI